MLARRSLLACLVALAPLQLVGCGALRGPEPYGPTFVTPPGPLVGNRAVRTVPTQPQYGPSGTLQGAPTYVPGPAPPYTPGAPLQGSPGVQMGGQAVPTPGTQSQYPPQAGAPVLPPAPGSPGVPSNGVPSLPPAPAAQVTARITGPARAIAGATVGYRIDVISTSPTVVRDAAVTCQLPAGWAYVGSSVAATVTGQQVQWRLGNVPANRTLGIDVNLRPEALGPTNLCVDLSVAGGTPTRSCTTTTVEALGTPGAPKSDKDAAPPAGSPLEIKITGPERANPSDEVTYSVTVTNRGSQRATKLLVTDEFDSGLVHDVAVSPIEKDLDDLEPGESTTFKVTFRVARAGRHCHTVEVTGAGGLRATAKACVEAVADLRLTVRQVATPTSAAVGGTVRFAIDIKNEGNVDLTGLVVASTFDRVLRPTQATEIRGRQALANLKDGRYELTPYRFDRLEPGKSIQLDVECKAEQAAASACGRVTVTSQEGAREEALTCLKIEGAEAAPAGGR